MSYNDYLAGLRDGVNIGVNIGFNAGFNAGYNAGYRDASAGLPYQPRERLIEYQSTLPEPLPMPIIDPLPLPRYEPPLIDLTPKYDPIPKFEPLNLGLNIDPLPRYETPTLDIGNKYDPFQPLGKPKKPWEY